MEKILTIDIGTSALKVALFDLDGFVLQLESSTYKNVTYDGISAEQDPGEWWHLTCQLVTKITKALGNDRLSVRAIGITGQMHGAVHVNDTTSLGPVINYQDRRARKEHKELLPYHDLFYNRTGAFLDVNMIPAKLRHLSSVSQELMRETKWLLAPKDYIRWKLTDEPATDPIDAAGFLLYDLSIGKWDEELCNLSHIDIGKLPPILPTISTAAKLKPTVAHMLGLSPDAIVSIGGGDDIEALGSGADIGDFYEHLGTSGSICLVTDKCEYDPAKKVEIFPDVIPGRYLIGGSTSSAGAADKWFRENVNGMNIEFEKILTKAVIQQSPSSITFLPYLTGARCPQWDSERKAVFAGLTLAHTAEDLMQAVAEGVAYSLKDILHCLYSMRSVDHSSVYSTGGMGTSSAYGQIRADIYGHTVVRLTQQEATSYAAMMIAGTVAGFYSNIFEVAKNFRKVAWTSQPRSEMLKAYQTGYSAYCNIQARLKGV